MIIYVLDLVGTFAFAFVGAQVALRHKLGGLGIVAAAALTAVGGGTAREVLLQHTPFYFYDYAYLVAILAAILGALVAGKRLRSASTPVIALEAIGTVVFAFNGAQAAMNAQLGLPAMVLFAGLTAFGGGLLCDLVVGRTPRILRDSLCMLPALCLGALYWSIGSAGINPGGLPVACGLLISAYCAQLCIGCRPQLTAFWRRMIEKPLASEASAAGD